MKRTTKKKLNLSKPSLLDLNKSSTGCAPCLNEALKIERKINKKSLHDIKINEIKEIVNSIFKSSKNVYKKN
jgi:hypothetical protein|tara:strand:- start:2175 stop:2390 length:216 start_codon:yes stop_codon:yes gene_type:complete